MSKALMMALDAHKKNFMAWLKAACDYHGLVVGQRTNDHYSLAMRAEHEAGRCYPKLVFIASDLCVALGAGGPASIYRWVNEHRQWLEVPSASWEQVALDRKGRLERIPRDEPTVSDERRHHVRFRCFEILTTWFKTEIARQAERAEQQRRQRIIARREESSRKPVKLPPRPIWLQLNHRERRKLAAFIRPVKLARLRPIDMGGERDHWMSFSAEDQYWADAA